MCIDKVKLELVSFYKKYSFLIKRVIVLFLVLTLGMSLHAQRPGKAYRTGTQAFKNGEYIRAVGWLSIAIEAQKSKFNDAYYFRAESYCAMNRIDDAIKDYIVASKLFPDRADITLKTSRLLYNQKNYNEALQFATSTLDIDTANFEAMKIQSLALTHMGNAESGLMISDQASQIKEDAEVLYAKALASDSLGLIDYAIAYYNEAISINKSFKPPYHDMGRLLVRNGYLEKALDVFTQAAKEFNDPDSYRLRSLIYGVKGNTLAQISDLTKILTLEPTRIDLYFERAEQYKKVNLLQNGLSDITYYIKWDPYSSAAWLLKGQLLEKLYMNSKAIEAFEKVLEYAVEKNQIDYANQAIFKLKKEKYPPKISIISPPVPDKTSISLGKNQNKVLIKGKAEDASKIKYVLINGKKSKITKINGGVNFSIQMTVDTISFISITAADEYNNVVSNTYKILRVEKNPPRLFLQSPVLTVDSAIEVTQSKLAIKGFFYESSGLKWLRINGKTIQPQEVDDRYYFNDKLDVINNDSLIIETSDYFSNEITYRFNLLHSDTINSFSSPLGKSWYVLVVTDSIERVLPEIRQYKTELIKKLKHYDLDSLIVISSANKEILERKLIFELPEAIRQNRIETMILHVVSPGVTKGGFTYWMTPKLQGKKPYDLLNTSILRTYFNANKFIKYNTVISESVSVGSNVFEPVNDCNCKDCNEIQNYPDGGQLIVNINVANWHTYKSPYLSLLDTALKNNKRCFSVGSFASKKTLNVSFGTLKGNDMQAFPATIYLRQ